MKTFKRRKLSDRILAGVMAVLMVFSLMPMHAVDVKAAPDDTVTIAFHVQDEDGNAVSGATVSVDGVALSSSTNEVGNVTAEDLEKKDSYAVEVSKTGYLTTSTSVGNDQPNITITLTALKTASGTVTSNGSGISGASMTLSGQDEPITTGENGEFSFSGLNPNETYTVAISKEGYKSKVVTLSLNDTNTIELEAKVTQQLTFTPASVELTCGGENVIILAKTASNVVADSYVSNDTDVAVIITDGDVVMVKAVGFGQTTITATLAATDDYLESTATCNVYVKKGTAKSLKWKSNAPADGTSWVVALDSSAIVDTEAEGGVSTGTISYKSGDEDVATVEPNGMVHFKKPGTVKITATQAGDDNYDAPAPLERTLKAVKADQDNLVFADMNPSDVSLSAESETVSFSNAASFVKGENGHNEDATIEYSSSNEDIATVDENGELTIKKGGEVTITATVAGGTLYNDATAKYTLKINKLDQDAELTFTRSKDLTYGEEYQFVAEGGNTGDISYSIRKVNDTDPDIAVIDKTNGIITTKKAGMVYVVATSNENGIYKEKKAEYLLTISRAERTLEFERVDDPENPEDDFEPIHFGETFQNRVKDFTGSVTYSILVGDAYAQVDEYGIVTAIGLDKESEQTTVTVLATVAEDDRYLAKSIKYNLSIIKADQTITFDNGAKPVISFNDNGNVYVNHANTSVDLATEEGIVATYSIESGEDLIEKVDEKLSFDAETGEFTFTGAGPVDGDGNPVVAIKVKVSFSGNDHYNAAEKTYDLTIKKAKQVMKFYKDEKEVDDQQPIVVYVGEQDSFVKPELQFEGLYCVDGALVYSVESDSQNIVVWEEGDEVTGDVALDNTINVLMIDPSVAIISASKAGDNNYEPAEATYRIELRHYQSTETNVYVITGNKNSSTGWYTSKVSIRPKATNGIDDYILYRLDNKAYTSENPIKYEDDGNFGNIIIYYMKTTGSSYKSKAGEEIIKIDTKAPENVSITAQKNSEQYSTWDKFLSFITFGANAKNQQLNFTITATDQTSGIYKEGLYNYYWYYIDYDVTQTMTAGQLNNVQWTKVKNGQFSVDGRDKEFVVYAKVVDNAGNFVYANTNGIIFDSTKPVVAHTIKSEKSASGYFYTGDVEIKLHVTDQEPYSGIQSISYWIENNGVRTVPEIVEPVEGEPAAPDKINLYTYTYSGSDPKGPGKEDLVYEWDSEESQEANKNIIVPAALNNGDNVKVYVEVKDNAKNTTIHEVPLAISISNPIIDVTFENDPEFKGTLNEVSYYAEERTAKIVITNRKSAFDQGKVNIVIEQQYGDSPNQCYDYVNAESLHWDETINNEDENLTTYTAYVKFTGSAQYDTFQVSYTDKADHSAIPYSAPAFAVDTDKPTGSITIDESNTWAELLESLTFALYKNENVSVSATATDKTSPIKSIQYFISESDEIMTETELRSEEIVWNTYAEFSISTDKRFVVYLKITDYAGNYDFICSDGYIVDMTDSIIKLDYEKANANGFYNKDLSVNVYVEDKEPYSGIKKVEYWVTKGKGEKEQRTRGEVLYDFTNPRPSGALTHDKLKSKLNQIDDDKITTVEIPSFTVFAIENNDDVVKLYVKVEDNAGNVTYYGDQVDDDGNNYVPLCFAANPPKIDIVYDQNTPFTTDADGRSYFKSRTATIYVKNRESAFDAEQLLAGIVVTGTDANGEHIDLKIVTTGTDANVDPVELNNADVIMSYLGELPQEEGDLPDDLVHKFEVQFLADANYDFTISYEDKAEQKCEYNSVTFRDGTRKESDQFFTVDSTDPTAKIVVNGYTWTTLLDVLTFGLWTNNEVVISASANDATSPYIIQYYKTDNVKALTKEDLDKVEKWEDSIPAILDNERFVVYMKVTDYAGNYIYINSDGYILDKTNPGFTITLPDPVSTNNENIGIYHGDVTAVVDITESAPYSGIQKVEYWVEKEVKDGKGVKMVATQGNSENPISIFSFDYLRDKGDNVNSGVLDINQTGKESVHEEGHTPVHTTLFPNLQKEIVVSSSLNNSSNVVLNVRVTDNAGNVENQSVKMDIDITKPTISVRYSTIPTNETEQPQQSLPYNTVKDKEERGYFPANRQATIVITERSNHFEEDKVNISLKAVNAKNEVPGKFDLEAMKEKWHWDHSQDDNDPDKDTHTLIIDYTEDANYEFDISYEDMAKNQNEGIDFIAAEAPFNFTVDKVVPKGNVKVTDSSNNDWSWDKLINTLTFGIWKNNAVTVSGSSWDETSRETFVYYYKTNETTAKTEEQLKKITNWEVFKGLSESPNQQFTVYLKIVDLAGNTTYISTDGVIVDDAAPAVENVAPEIIVEANGGNGIYRQDATISVSVYDPVVGGTYSGIKSIEYSVSSMGTVTQSNILYQFGNQNPIQRDLQQSWNGTFVVDSHLNNSNDVAITVSAVDNSGNRSSRTEHIMIDISQPVISVNYDNNDGDATFRDDTTDAFFKNDRVATIAIHERNFDPNRVSVVITNTDGVIPNLSGWSHIPAGGNGDGDLHTATISYSADGDYTFEVSCVDLAGNLSNGVDYGNSLAPQKFTIDKTLPQIEVEYDNIMARNGNYYKAERTATITIREHNFETSRIKTKILAEDDGTSITAPTISNWTSQGDVHVATIKYDKDALYTFDIDYEDKAGNKSANLDEQKFYVDMTMPTVKIEGVSDQSANKGKIIGITITASDTNFDLFEPEIKITKMTKNKTTNQYTPDGPNTATEVFEFSSIHNGQIATINNFAEDGVYFVTCNVMDKAGNEFDQVIYVNDQKQESVKSATVNNPLIYFSVNRNGSTFDIGDETLKLKNKKYVQTVNDDIVLVEINADELTEQHVTLNGSELTKDKDYSVVLEDRKDASEWYKYTYTISKSLFAAEGDYKIEISSVDKAENKTYMDNKEVTMTFVVDRTAPIVTVSGITPSGRYQTESQTVTIIPSDAGGQLKSLIVALVDSDNTTIRELVNLEGEALEQMLANNDEKITFSIDEGLYQNVRIICDDYADYTDETNIIYDEVIKNVSIANSAILIFWANKPLRYGTMGGVVALIGVVIFVVARKRRRR